MYHKCKWSVFNRDGCVLKHLHIWRKMFFDKCYTMFFPLRNLLIFEELPNKQL